MISLTIELSHGNFIVYAWVIAKLMNSFEKTIRLLINAATKIFQDRIKLNYGAQDLLLAAQTSSSKLWQEFPISSTFNWTIIDRELTGEFHCVSSNLNDFYLIFDGHIESTLFSKRKTKSESKQIFGKANNSSQQFVLHSI